MEIRTAHRFKDEWLAKALVDYEIVDNTFVDELRARYADEEYLADVLIKNKHLLREDIADFVENILQIPYVDLKNVEVDPKAVEQVPEEVCQRFLVFPFELKDDHISVAFSNPFDLDAEREIAYLSGKFVKTYFAFNEDIREKIAEYYSPDKLIDKLVDRANIDKAVKIADEGKDKKESSVVKLVALIIGDAIDQEASDIHIEPKEKVVVVRYRIDGILRTILEIPKSIHNSLVSRIKILSSLDIAETRKPQDGKATVFHEGAEIDLRISVLPTTFGEKVVIRILDSRKAKVSFEELGLQGKNLELIEQVFSKTQGIILVTGPTGSGKTTTLYAALNRIRNNTNNILTIEDPIEYVLEGVNQVQVNEKAGVTFASALRSFLRQDPDVILVGEIRDRETAEIAIQASLTGHLVLSTLHTNDALGAITRLQDMGIGAYKIASSLEAVIAQRLVRKLCKDCKKISPPTEDEKKLIPFIRQMGYEPKFYHAEGCQSCGYTGYKGRIGVYEILIIDDEIKELISSGAPANVIKKMARKKGFRTLYEDALEHIAKGITDLKEVMRVISKAATLEVKEESAPPAGSSAARPEREALSGGSEVREVAEKTEVPAIPEKFSDAVSGEEEQEPPREVPRILLVEDNEGMRKLARTLISKKTNWELYEAADGAQALELVNKVRPDLIVLDIMMPNMNGYEFLEKIRQNLATATIPVLILTALDSYENEVKGFSLGADDYLTKPYNINVLLARMKRLLMKNRPHFKVSSEMVGSIDPNKMRLI